MKNRKDTSWSDHYTSAHWISHRFVTATQQFEIEVYVKVSGRRGIRHLLRWAQDYDEEQLVQETLSKGTFSARPYRLSQGVDFTTAACVDTLFHHFCVARHLDCEALYYEAYQKRVEPDTDQHITRQLAEWQGLIYPNQWNDSEVLKLLQSLATGNNHGLVTSILKALPHLESRFYPVKEVRAEKEEEQSDEAS